MVVELAPPDPSPGIYLHSVTKSISMFRYLTYENEKLIPRFSSVEKYKIE